MTTYTDDTVSNLVINKLTKAQYEAIQNPSDTELYIVEDAKLSYNELSDKPIIDQTYDSTSANAQSGIAIQTKLSSDYYTKAEVDAMLGNIEAILQRLNSGNNS